MWKVEVNFVPLFKLFPLSFHPNLSPRHGTVHEVCVMTVVYGNERTTKMVIDGKGIETYACHIGTRIIFLDSLSCVGPEIWGYYKVVLKDY